ncbi:MAG TPA: pyridoxal-phosphate dependent enzyme [Actinophytocola sp.]|uniref:threonine ammonia-lyase n=1 Tax=Actinophytocola sp. TaxID=1872138 RepID=UPI002DB85762|nr:pyridoxal-phosphate dependent enzyme [Actinophytocola sp.]HEU5471786.1 pyridoxal-phosphate dependent enzyme [Actinophytocola sp.]
MTDDVAAGTDLSLERIELAARVIDPVFRDTPQYIDEQLCAALGRQVIVKVETANPIRSFKGRGTDYLIGQLEPGRHPVCVSTGNFGQGVAYAARRRSLPATVFTPTGTSPSKLDRIRALGAEVISIDSDPRAAAAEFVAHSPSRLLVKDGGDPRIAEGAATIAVELFSTYRPDTLVVPVGDGALITGIARWAKAVAPTTRIIGICAAGAPAMLHSWHARTPRQAPATTIAEGLAITTPIPESLNRMLPLIDDLLEIPDAPLLDAMRLAARTLGLLLEPSGAVGLAALTTLPIPGTTVATILTGSNLRTEHLHHLN